MYSGQGSYNRRHQRGVDNDSADLIADLYVDMAIFARLTIRRALIAGTEPPVTAIYLALDYVTSIAQRASHQLTDLERELLVLTTRLLELLELDAHECGWRCANMISEALLAMPPEWGVASVLTPQCRDERN